MAGLLGTALAGAMAGGGQAVQQNAMSRIDQLRQEALQKLTHGQAMERQEHQQEFTAGENQADRSLRREEGQLGREHDTRLAEMRESGANRRTGMTIGARRAEGRNDWQLVRTEDGMVQWSPSRNEYRQANLPEGAQMGGSKLSDRDKYRLDGIADQIEAIRKQAGDEMRELTTEEKAQLGRLQSQYDGLLGGGGGATTLERLLAGEHMADNTATSEEGASRPSLGETGGEPTVRGLLSQQMGERRNTQEANEARRSATLARDKADGVLNQIERIRDAGRSNPNTQHNLMRSTTVPDELMDEARQVADELLALDHNSNLSADQKRWLAERLLRLRDAGVPVDLEE